MTQKLGGQVLIKLMNSSSTQELRKAFLAKAVIGAWMIRYLPCRQMHRIGMMTFRYE